MPQSSKARRWKALWIQHPGLPVFGVGVALQLAVALEVEPIGGFLLGSQTAPDAVQNLFFQREAGELLHLHQLEVDGQATWSAALGLDDHHVGDVESMMRASRMGGAADAQLLGRLPVVQLVAGLELHRDDAAADGLIGDLPCAFVMPLQSRLLKRAMPGNVIYQLPPLYPRASVRRQNNVNKKLYILPKSSTLPGTEIGTGTRMNATASPQKTSMMECCLVKTVDAQMSAAQPEGQHFEPRAVFRQRAAEKAMAIQAELWQWMEGQTFTEASAFQIAASKSQRRCCLTHLSSTVGRMSRPLGSTI